MGISRLVPGIHEHMRNLLFATLIGLGLFLQPMPAEQAPAPYFQEDGYANKGYDVVAYFNKGEPTKGVKEFSYQWKGATWLFADAKNLEAFKAEPDKYAPQYGGYCAYAASKNKIASVNPKNWKIVDGKLYLNHDIAHTLWKRNIPENIKKADQNWPNLAKQPAK